MPREIELERATEAQRAVIESVRPVIVRACPGAGKTRLLIERTQRLLSTTQPRKGVAILSFSNSAIDEVSQRFGQDAPPFPSFVGTFDSFLWRFFIAPFGAADPNTPANLFPDLGEIEFSPTSHIPGATPMRNAKLRWFNRDTGAVHTDLKGDDLRDTQGFTNLAQYEAHARTRWQRLKASGAFDHDMARELAHARLTSASNHYLIDGLSHRFVELLVDEAQDCNPADLEVIQALRERGVPVTVIGDYDQAIYGFRHGAPPELANFANQYDAADRHSLVHNFRCAEGICSLAAVFRGEREPKVDVSLAEPASDHDGAHIIGYAPARGNAVNGSVSASFSQLMETAGISASKSPIISHRLKYARRAAGLKPLDPSNAFVVKLASSIATYSAAAGHWRTRVEALKQIIALIFDHCGHMQQGETFHQCLVRREEDEQSYRGVAIELAEQLKPLLGDADDPRRWLERAKTTLQELYPEASPTRLRMPSGKSLKHLKSALELSGGSLFPVSTIHRVKGQEFPAVCVVIPPNSADELLRRIETGEITEAERVLFVGVTRAQRICALALPQAYVARITALLDSVGAPYTLHAA